MTAGSLTKSEEFLYFAYGSNMFDPWLQRRCTSARAVGICAALGYRFSFSKRSDDELGKGNIVRTLVPTDVVHGVVFAIENREREALDAAEKNYDPVAAFVVRHAGHDLSTLTYVAKPDFIDERLQPYDWYHRLTIVGAANHGLPPNYIDIIAANRPITDPKNRRKLRLLALQLLADDRGGLGR